MEFFEAAGGSATDVIGEWKAASLAGTWRFPSDWECPAVWLLADTADDAEVDLGAVRGLAIDRATMGVGIGEGLDDLEAFFVARGRTIPQRAVRHFVEAWNDHHEATLIAMATTDPRSGLFTPEVFVSHLHEVYLQRARRDAGHGRVRSLMFLFVPEDASTPMMRFENATRVGYAISNVFCDGEAATMLRPSRYAVLANDRSDALRKLRRLRSRLSEFGHSPRINIVEHLTSVPRTFGLAAELLVRYGADARMLSHNEVPLPTTTTPMRVPQVSERSVHP